MSDLEQLIRGALAEDAGLQPAPTDLVSVAVRRGRQLRSLHRASVGALASAAAVAAVVVAINVVVPSGRNVLSNSNVPAAGNPGPASGVSSEHPSPPPTAVEETPTNWNEKWPTGRVFGTAASSDFLSHISPGERLTVYASGHASDGTTFVMYTTPDRPDVPQWVQGFNSTSPDFGQDGSFSCNGKCDVFEYPSAQTYAGTATTQWLVATTAPGVVSMDYSEDGNSWRSMDFRGGLALLELPSIAPRSAELRVTSTDGRTVETSVYPAQGSEPAASNGATKSYESNGASSAGPDSVASQPAS